MGVMTMNSGLTVRLALGTCAIALSCLSTLVIPNNAQAAVFKCTDADGGVSYNQIPCAGPEETEKVLATNTTKNTNVDCRIANNFARQIAVRMRMGQSSGSVFDSYGGIDALPRTSVGIVSYVYSHKDNVDTGPQRIAALSAARCSTGSYGPVACDDFPYNFVSELGGCEQAAMSTMQSQMPAAPYTQTNQPAVVGTTHTLGAKTTANQSMQEAVCQQNIQAKLNALVEQMRAGQSASQQNRLQDRKNELRDRMSNC